MKKIFTTTKGIEYAERRRGKLAKRKIKKKRSKERKNDRKLMSNEKSRRINIPIRLDPLESGNDSIRVYNRILKLLKRKRIRLFIDLSKLESFSLAGVIFLSACINSKNEDSESEVIIEGNLPKDPRVASEFLKSGFFDKFRKKDGITLPLATASWINAKEKQVVSRKAADLIEFANNKIGISFKQQRAIWQNLVECMTNTHNHASGTEEGSKTESWIAGVRCVGNIAYFTFIDQGVGISESNGAKKRLSFLQKTILTHGADKIVREAFEGKLPSSTNLEGRGLGLPRMKRDAQNNLLENLKIRTGNVEGDISKMKFFKQSEYLRGTVFAWEARSGDEDAIDSNE